MSNLSDTIRTALNKKKGQHHLENDAVPLSDATAKKKRVPPPVGNKPPARNTGRGR